jgi:GNAT superfamily N-acetyltransferase
MPEKFQVRRASPADAATIAWHRARMFQDMGQISPEGFEILKSKAQARIEQVMQSGEYLGWLASPASRPELIVAGAGVYLHLILPRPMGGSAVGEGRQGTIVNVFTEPEWRKQGLARRLLEDIIAWARDQKFDRLVLHSSEAGRSLYERVGFVANNEMRLKEQ